MSVGHESIDASNYRALRFKRQGDVLIITIDHPSNKLNAVDDVLHTELTRLFADLKRESRARAAVITGAGRMFSAGGDFDWFPTLSNLEALEHLRRDAKQMIWDLLDVPIPIVAAVNGPAVGLGASLALLCDTIYMAESAHIADPHVMVGIVAGDGGAAIWPLAVGPARAKQYLMTGDPVPAAEAERVGLVNAVVPDAELLETAIAFATRLAAEGMGVNPVAGFFHDHLFIPADRANDAMRVLLAMRDEARAGARA